MMLDLFNVPIVPGLSLREGFLMADEEPDLIARIDSAALAPFKFQQWTGKRLTRSFGWNYDFESGDFSPGEPMPEWLLALRDRAADFARLDPEDLVQALLIRYDPGAGIGWHKDRSVFGEVVGISLGQEAILRLRRRDNAGFTRAKTTLPPLSAYHLSGEVRHQWEHSIAPMDLPRWSITFRSLAPVTPKTDKSPR
jgi:DNA oxidative demethylase